MHSLCGKTLGLLVCTAAAALLCSPAQAQEKFLPNGKGEWINYTAQARANVNANYGVTLNTDADLASFLYNNLQIRWVAVKCAGGDQTAPQFTNSLVAAFHNAGMNIYGWDEVTAATNARQEGLNARRLIDSTGADGLIIVPYVSRQSANPIFYASGAAKANAYWGGLQSGNPGAPQFAVGFSADSDLNTGGYGAGKSPAPTASALMPLADFWVPRSYWSQGTPNRLQYEINSINTYWLHQPNQKPVVVVGQCQGTAGNYSVITNFKTAVNGMAPTAQASALYALDKFTYGDFQAW